MMLTVRWFGCGVCLLTAFMAWAETDLLPLIQKTEHVIEKTYADEELSQKYYKDKVKKILESSGSDENKAAELNKIIAKVQASSKATGKPSAPVKEVPINKGNIRDSLIIVVGEKGVGSGFITVFNGKKVAVTNIHVLMGNRQVKFLDCNNNRLEYSRIYFAGDRDIAIIELDESVTAPALPMAENIAKCASEEPVMVSGNSQGAGVVTRIEGTIKGIGPTVVEVSAAFVQGNSGSPIVSLKTGKVVGVATFAVKANENWVNKGSGFEKVRRFGTRIDNLSVDALEKFSSKSYGQDLDLFRKLKDRNTTCLKVLSDFERNRGILVDGHYLDDVTMQRIVRRWNDALTNPRFGTSYMNILSEIIRHIEEPARLCRNREIHYGFIRNEIKNQLTLNELLVKHLNSLKATLDEYRKRMSRQARGV